MPEPDPARLQRIVARSESMPTAEQFDDVMGTVDRVIAASGPTPHAAQHPGTPGDVLVLSGGGLYGAAQAGMLAALCENTTWRPAAIVGVSAGALNGSWMAHDFTAGHAEHLVELWSGFTGRGAFPARTVSQLLKVIARRDAIQDGAALRRIIDKCSPTDRLEDLTIPLHVAATSLTTGGPVWFDAGPAVDILYASAAIPGVVPPITIDGDTYVDGGVVANLPVLRAAELGAQRILCLDVSVAGTARHAPDTALGILLRSFAIALNAATESSVEHTAAQRTLWRVQPEVPHGLRTTDWGRCAELTDLGHATMSAWLADNVAHLERPPAAPPGTGIAASSWTERFGRLRFRRRRSALPAPV